MSSSSSFIIFSSASFCPGEKAEGFSPAGSGQPDDHDERELGDPLSGGGSLCHDHHAGCRLRDADSVSVPAFFPGLPVLLPRGRGGCVLYQHSFPGAFQDRLEPIQDGQQFSAA